MLRCSWCARGLEPMSAWRGRGEMYYCSEFCAETESIESPRLVPISAEEQPQLLRRARAR